MKRGIKMRKILLTSTGFENKNIEKNF